MLHNLLMKVWMDLAVRTVQHKRTARTTVFPVKQYSNARVLSSLFFFDSIYCTYTSGYRPHVTLSLQFTLLIIRDSISFYTQNYTHDLGHRCVAQEKDSCKRGGLATPGDV